METSSPTRHFDLNGEARMARAKQSSRSLGQFKRFRHVINSDKVFGTHRSAPLNRHARHGLIWKRPP
jgi:hypothetical protein